MEPFLSYPDFRVLMTVCWAAVKSVFLAMTVFLKRKTVIVILYNIQFIFFKCLQLKIDMRFCNDSLVSNAFWLCHTEQVQTPKNENIKWAILFKCREAQIRIRIASTTQIVILEPRYLQPIIHHLFHFILKGSQGQICSFHIFF